MNAQTEHLVKGWNFHPMVDSEVIHGPRDLYAALAVDITLAGMNAALPRMDDRTLELVCNAAYTAAETALRLAHVSTAWADLLPALVADDAACLKFFQQCAAMSEPGSR